MERVLYGFLAKQARDLLRECWFLTTTHLTRSNLSKIVNYFQIGVQSPKAMKNFEGKWTSNLQSRTSILS